MPSMAISHPPLAGLVFDLLPDVDIACKMASKTTPVIVDAA